MNLEAILRPVIRDLEEKCKKLDGEGFVSFYEKNAIMVDVAKKTLCNGHQEILKQFHQWTEMGKDWIPETSNEQFSGSEDLIRYSSRCNMKKDGQTMAAFDAVQYWRKNDGKYRVEMEHYTFI